MDGKGKVYGIKAWNEWNCTQTRNLTDYKQFPRESNEDDLVHQVGSYLELFQVVAFLNLMNKNSTLLFRGQSTDLEPRPTLFRDHPWTVPGTGQSVDLAARRDYYWNQLDRLCSRVRKVLEGRLPRHRPFENYEAYERLKVAPWAVIQHYELWPTPLIDLTSSLRIAASFALGVPRGRRQGWIYVYDLENIIGDLMWMTPLNRDRVKPPPDPITFRLSSVCPPDMDRPHLQEGYLFGHSEIRNLEEANVSTTRQLAGRLVAKFRLVDKRENGKSTFWMADFPKHRINSLLPVEDKVKKELDRNIRHKVVAGRAVLR